MRHLLAIAAALAVEGLALAPTGVAGKPATQPLNPPAPAYYSCKAVGQGTICDGNPPVESFGPIDTVIFEGFPSCGAGSGAFDMFDTATDEVSAHRVYDANGNLVKRVLTDDYTFGQFSNPLNGKTVPYRQRDRRTDVPAVPGDMSTATETTTWEIQFHVPGGGAPLLLHNGRTVVGADGTLEASAGRLEFNDLFVGGDTSVLDPLCNALAGP